eukprot:Clim_evm51s149 gene=Clim_evmTU51s149
MLEDPMALEQVVGWNCDPAVMDKESVDMDVQELRNLLNDTLKHSHSPYSNFRVSCVMFTKSGRRFVGTNVENASFGLTTCAERSAIFSAVSQGDRDFVRCAIMTDSPVDGVAPCGACRQVIAEFCDNDMPIDIYSSAEEEVAHMTLGELLPVAFRSSRLRSSTPGSESTVSTSDSS